MSDSKFLRGTLILTAATFLSKFLGMIYVFPFYQLVGPEGGALYSYAYNPYTIMLGIATMGVPMAVSKFVAKYNALGDYQTGRRLFKSGMLLMSLTGFLAFLFLFFIAPFIAPYIVNAGDSHGNTVAEVTSVIRMVSFALLLVPLMSLYRGFFQGHESMGPTAVSQVIEQVIRIIVLLGASWIIIELLKGDISVAVGWATFAAFIGAIGGFLVLLVYWKKRKSHFDHLLEKNSMTSNLSYSVMYKELISYALPFVYVGIAIPLYQLIDQFTFNRTMASIGLGEIAETTYSLIVMYNHKLVMIPVSLATGFSLALIPAITKSYTANNQKVLHNQISKALQILLFLVLPAVIGMSTLAYPIFSAFYELEHVALGGMILRWYAPVALLFALFTVTTAILQGINQQRFAVISLSGGLLIKLILNVPFISQFASIGSILATASGFLFATLFNLLIINRYANHSFRLLLKRSMLISIFVIAMGIIVVLSQRLMQPILSYLDGRFEAVISIGLSILLGIATYFWLSMRSNLVTKLFGDRFNFIKKRKKATEL